MRRLNFVVVAMEMPESCRVRIDLIGAAERVCTVEQEPMEDTLCRARKTPLGGSEGDHRYLEYGEEGEWGMLERAGSRRMLRGRLNGSGDGGV